MALPLRSSSRVLCARVAGKRSRSEEQPAGCGPRRAVAVPREHYSLRPQSATTAGVSFQDRRRMG